MARTNLGRVVPLHKGDYSTTIEYELNDIVSYNGSTYWHFTHEKTTGILPTETSVWKLVIDMADAEQYIARAETAALQAEGYADDAQSAKTDAETAKADAETAEQGAVSAKQDALVSEENARSYMTAAQTAKGQAESARDIAIQAKTDAVGAKEESVSARDAAITAKDTAVDAKNTAVSAKNDAVSAKTGAETAKAAAQTAKAEAETAQMAAESAKGLAQSAASSAASSASSAETAKTAAQTAQTGAESAKAGAEAAAETAAEIVGSKTSVSVGGAVQTSLAFTSDPQTQITSAALLAQNAVGNPVYGSYFAYEQDVPAGARQNFIIHEIGGCCEVVDGEMAISKCDAIISKNENGVEIDRYDIPSALLTALATEGYGYGARSARNYIDFDSRKYHHNVGAVDLGSLTWTRASHSEVYYFQTTVSDAEGSPSSTGRADAINALYDVVKAAGYASTALSADKTCYFLYGSNRTTLRVRDDDYTDETAFKESLDGVYLYYELRTKQTIDISEYLTGENNISVVDGGSVILHNQDDSDNKSYSKISYYVDSKQEKIKNIPVVAIEEYHKAIGTDGNVTDFDNGKYTQKVEIQKGADYVVKYHRNYVTNNNRLHEYKSDGTWIKQTLIRASGTDADVDVMFRFTPDENTKFVCVSLGITDGDVSVEYADRYYVFDTQNGIKNLDEFVSVSEVAKLAKELGLHTIPDSMGALNAVRMARQITDCKWIPAIDLPRAVKTTGDTYLTPHTVVFTNNKFAEGSEYSGIPYINDAEKHNGLTESLDCFFTAVANENSVVSLESTPVTSSGNGGCYYGTNCQGLTSYALNIPPTSSANYQRISGMVKQDDLYDSGGNRKSIDYLQIGDILHKSSHVAMITDIVKDSDGNITNIEVSESTRQGCVNMSNIGGKFGGVARRVMLTIDEFYEWNRGFAVRRYSHIDKVKYTPSKYVPMVNEGNPIAPTDLPILPYMGNNCCYPGANEQTVKLLIADTVSDYDVVIVLKNGVEYDTIDISGDYIEVTCDTNEAEYSAVMVKYDASQNIKYQSMSCSWYIAPVVIPTFVYDSSNDKTTFTVTFGRKEFKPFYVSRSGITNDGYSVKIFDEEMEIVENQNGSTTYTFTVSGEFTAGTSKFAYYSPKFGEQKITLA